MPVVWEQTPALHLSASIMERGAAEGAVSNYAAALKTMDAAFTFISATAFSSAAEKSHPGHRRAAEPDGGSPAPESSSSSSSWQEILLFLRFCWLESHRWLHLRAEGREQALCLSMKQQKKKNPLCSTLASLRDHEE